MPVFPLQSDNPKYFQTLPHGSWGTKLPLVENYCSYLTRADFSQAKKTQTVKLEIRRELLEGGEGRNKLEQDMRELPRLPVLCLLIGVVVTWKYTCLQSHVPSGFRICWCYLAWLFLALILDISRE